MSERVFFTSDCHAKAESLFHEQAKRLREWLPMANLQHVGSTAIPGCLSKGDLDILVRVSAQDFFEADGVLAARYERNTENERSENYASFKDDTLDPPLGIQLTVIDGPFDDFWKWRDLLLARPDLCKAYNDLKCAFHGKSMDEYRLAKGSFIEQLMAE